jgi:hypothetical protein
MSDDVSVQTYLDSLAALEADSEDVASRKRASQVRLALLAALADADELLA